MGFLPATRATLLWLLLPRPPNHNIALPSKQSHIGIQGKQDYLQGCKANCVSWSPYTCTSNAARALPLQALPVQTILSDPVRQELQIQDQQTQLYPLILSSLAGASTCLGAAAVFALPTKKINPLDDPQSDDYLEQVLTFSLSFAASVMITVSVISVLPESLKNVIQFQSFSVFSNQGSWLEIHNMHLLEQRGLGFLSGCFAYWILSILLRMLPEPEESVIDVFEDNKGVHTCSTSTPAADRKDCPFPQQTREDHRRTLSERTRAWRLTLLIFFTLLLHNAPEGLAVAASSVQSSQLGLVVAIGIAAHNIPEGLVIAVPCLVAKPDSPWLAFSLASISGLAEPIGAFVALKVLNTGNNGNTLDLGNVLSGVAGIMCMVSMRDLYPEAFRHASKQKSKKNEMLSGPILLGTISGILLMTLTEWCLST